MQTPRTIAALRRVLGIVNYYRRFTKNAAEILTPFNAMLKGHTKRKDKTPIVWTDQSEKEFLCAKKRFRRVYIVAFPARWKINSHS